MDRTQFSIQVRQALRNLHDFAALQKLPLTRVLYSSAQSADRTGATPTLEAAVRQLRARMLDAIDRMNPGDALPGAPARAVSPRAKESRPYHLLYGRYVQGLGTPELVKELAISVRQLRREHNRALQSITDILWAELGDQLNVGLPTEPQSADSRREAAHSEVSRLVDQARIEEIDAQALLRGILTVLAPVAARFEAEIVDGLPDRLPALRADRVILRQALLEILSYALHHAVGGQLRLQITGEDAAGLTLSVVTIGGKRSSDRAGVGLDISRRLLAGIGGRVEIDAPASPHSAAQEANQEAKSWQARILLPVAADSAILVIDDNTALIQLFRRYLAASGGIPDIPLLEAHNAAEAIEVAANTRLRLAILDIMMPGQDGWEVLQHLRLAPETSSLPIVICSVLNEPEIAYGLGASGYLPKPVTEDAFLSVIERWCMNG